LVLIPPYYVARRVEATVAERIRVEEALRTMGLATADSQANFSWIDLGEADEAEVVSGLAERLIAVRPGAALGDPGHLRVSFGTAAENDRFLAALGELWA
jgi:histidinol-phosphate aminotransferase